jgi:ABC-type dipeptide/oligopeptide/nickel transport system permease component
MTRYVLGRLISLIFVLLAVSLITFFLMHSVPGGPFDRGERRLPAATHEAQLRKYGLDKPILVQYVKYVWAVLHFDFGVPFQRPTETVTGLIANRWPATIKVGIPTILLAYTVGTLLGFVAAVKQNSWLDYLVTTAGTIGLSVPNWVVATWFILVFSIHFKLLPADELHGPKYYIMPVVAYALTPMALVARYTRVSLLETMRADYVRTARAKGVGERRVLLAHVARNALIPWVTVLLPEIPNILTGSIFIESIFRIPGIGSYFATSALARDYPMIQALTLLIVVLWGLTYLLTDILYGILDPRIRLYGSRLG